MRIARVAVEGPVASVELEGHHLALLDGMNVRWWNGCLDGDGEGNLGGVQVFMPSTVMYSPLGS